MSEQARVRFGPDHQRCPYCKERVEDPDQRAVCSHCLALHHVECWGELGRCACCGQEDALLPAGVQPPAPPEPEHERPQPAPSKEQQQSSLTPEEAQLALEITRAELEWLAAEGLLPVQRTPQGVRYEAAAVAALRPRIEALMGQRQDALAATRLHTRHMRRATVLGAVVACLVLLATRVSLNAPQVLFPLILIAVFLRLALRRRRK